MLEALGIYFVIVLFMFLFCNRSEPEQIKTKCFLVFFSRIGNVQCGNQDFACAVFATMFADIDFTPALAAQHADQGAKAHVRYIIGRKGWTIPSDLFLISSYLDSRGSILAVSELVRLRALRPVCQQVAFELCSDLLPSRPPPHLSVCPQLSATSPAPSFQQAPKALGRVLQTA